MFGRIRRHPLIAFFLFVIASLLIYSIAADSDGLAVGDRIAVIEIDGIVDDSEVVIEDIEKARDNDRVKAVILRVNSPGGGVAPSQEIYSEIKKLKGEKKVVASLSSIATSGGYYIACAADRIVANPGTLTGSVGVIMDFTNVEGLFEKLGLKSSVVKSGRFKDIGSPAREMTAEEKELLQKVIDNVHEQFIGAIVEGRGMPEGEVRAVADGRIFSGAQAKELGFVDELGNLQDAVRLAAGLAGIEGKPKVVYLHKKKGLLDYILGGRVTDYVENLGMPRLMYRATFN